MREAYKESRACWEDQDGVFSLLGAKTQPQKKQQWKVDKWIYQEIEESGSDGEHCYAQRKLKKMKKDELFAKMAYYKSSKLSHQNPF